MPLANTCPILRHMSTFGHVIRPGLSPGLTQVPQHRQSAGREPSKTGELVDLPMPGANRVCGGVQHREIKSAGIDTLGGACGGLSGKKSGVVTAGNPPRGRAASERSEIVSEHFPQQARTVTRT